jgi:hypothetical protein
VFLVSCSMFKNTISLLFDVICFLSLRFPLVCVSPSPRVSVSPRLVSCFPVPVSLFFAAIYLIPEPPTSFPPAHLVDELRIHHHLQRLPRRIETFHPGNEIIGAHEKMPRRHAKKINGLFRQRE